MVRYTYASMRTTASSKLSKTYGARLEAQKAPVIWSVSSCAPPLADYLTPYLLHRVRLGTHAFHAVLSRKSHEYTNILRSLEFDLRLPKYARHRKRLARVVKDGAALLCTLDF